MDISSEILKQAMTNFDLAKQYVFKTHKRFTGEDPKVLGELEKTEHGEEFLDQIENYRFNLFKQLPSRDGEECSMCMICEEFCPTGAMNAETGEAVKGKCIVCLGCIAKCPEDVLKINDLSASWSHKLEMEKATEENIKRKKSKLYF